MSKKGKSKKNHDEDLKGILKKSSDENQENTKKLSKKSIKWDEINVTATLHPVGKDYGNMKISEVPTPYERTSAEDAKGVDAMELARRLEEAIQRDSTISETSEDYSVDADDEGSHEEEVRRRRFRERRKEHYKEYAIAKLRASSTFDSEDEDGDGKSREKNKK